MIKSQILNKSNKLHIKSKVCSKMKFNKKYKYIRTNLNNSKNQSENEHC